MLKRFKSILWCKVQVTPKFGCDRLFFFLWVGRVAPLFSGEDTVQGKEEKRVKKKRGLSRSVGRPVGLVATRQTQTDKRGRTCGRVDRQERGEREPWKGGMYLVVVVWVCRRK